MSDLNLPTIRIWRECDCSMPWPPEMMPLDYEATKDHATSCRGIASSVALVPVDQMEQVWWCVTHRYVGDPGADGSVDCRWTEMWLVSGEGAER